MISSGLDQTIFDQAHQAIATLVDQVAHSVDSLGLFDSSALFPADAEIRGEGLPPRNHVLVQAPDYIKMPDLTELKPDPQL